MKRILITLLVAFMFCVPVQAEEIYQEHYEQSGAETLKESLTDEVKGFLEKENIDMKDSDWVNKITAGNIFTEIFSFLKDGFKKTFKSGLAMFGVIVIFTAALGMESMKQYQKLISYVFAPICVLIIFTPLFSLIDSVVSAVKAGSVFMLSFVPLYAGILTVGGYAATATGMSFLLLFAAEAVSMISSFVIVPLMSCYLSIGLISGISQNGSSVALGELIKKAAICMLSINLTGIESEIPPSRSFKPSISTIFTPYHPDGSKSENSASSGLSKVKSMLVPIGSASNSSITSLGVLNS